MIDIILAEDHNVVRNGIRALLDKVDDYRIIGEAENGEQVLKLLDNGLTPDILLCDLNMPGMGGLKLTGALTASHPKIRVIILSMFDKEAFVVNAFKAGACAYLLKSITPDEMIFAIRHTHLYGKYLCSELALRFLDRLTAMPVVTAKEVDSSGIEFTDRDIEVLELIAEGHTNENIADRLFTSKRTVEGYRKQLLDKTGTANTAALVRFAMRSKLIS